MNGSGLRTGTMWPIKQYYKWTVQLVINPLFLVGLRRFLNLVSKDNIRNLDIPHI